MNYGTTPTPGFVQISEPAFLRALKNFDFRRSAFGDCVIYYVKGAYTLIAEEFTDGRIFIDPSYVPDPHAGASDAPR